MEPPGYRSFLVRLWLEPGLNACDEWRGEAEHIQSGRSWRFTSIDGLLALLRAATQAAEPQDGDPAPPPP